MKPLRFTIATLSTVLSVAPLALAADGEPTASELPETDVLRYRAEVDTVSRLFRRETYPGPEGALVAGGVAVPLYHYAMLRVDDIDAPWQRDAVDLELAGWGNLEVGEHQAGEGRVDGDLHVALVRHRFRYGYVTFGRQVRAGGAARFARFDGVSAGARTVHGMGLDTYGGFTVLPRWSARPGYQLLGSAADTLHRSPEVLEDPARDEHWLVGGRAYVERQGWVTAGVSVHEQREDGGLGRRNTGFDLRLTPLDALALTTQAILDMDAVEFSDVRASLDTYPMRGVTFSGTYQHIVPALMLSRQSVLSVFSTAAFDEWGVEADTRIARWMSLAAEGFVERFEDGALGGRGGGTVTLRGGGGQPAAVRLGYRRVQESLNGYHALRASVSLQAAEPLLLSGDGYLYMYDEPIENLSSSVVGVLSAGYRFDRRVDVTLSSSLARSPYATIDAQGLARISLALEGGGR
jgi:hypothetical protein